MREFGKVFCSIYESPDFRALSEDGRTLVLYLLTCKHATIAGVFRLPDGYACEDLQWSAERVREGFANVSAKGFATRCEVTQWVWVTKFLEWNPPENPNQRKAAGKAASRVPPQCTWNDRFLYEIGPSIGLARPSPKPVDGNPSATVGGPSLNQEQEKDKKQDQEQDGSAPDGAGGTPPSKSPEDLAKAELWRAAVSVLENGGCPISQCRTFMGKLVQDYSFEIVQKAVAAAVTAQPAEAREYLKASCQRLKGERKDPVTVASNAADLTKAQQIAEEARLADPEAKAKAEAARLAVMAKHKRPVGAGEPA